MCGCRCYIEYDDGDDCFVWIEDTERGTFNLIYIMIVDSQDYDLEYLISRPVVVEIV